MIIRVSYPTKSKIVDMARRRTRDEHIESESSDDNSSDSSNASSLDRDDDSSSDDEESGSLASEQLSTNHRIIKSRMKSVEIANKNKSINTRRCYRNRRKLYKAHCKVCKHKDKYLVTESKLNLFLSECVSAFRLQSIS